tara:strand:+ start:762 stop:1295 length:534 start_codon:yes stop_codon:yes gene_type:complete
MKLLTFKFLFLIIYLITSIPAFSSDAKNIKNLIIQPAPKKLGNVEFKDLDDNTIYLDDYKNRLVVINFWATWCTPCRDEIPSLNRLQINDKFNTIKIFPINVGRESKDKSVKFFRELKIDNINNYFDFSLKLPNKFALRGLPSTIFINKSGEEIGRIIGYTDFEDEDLINWLKEYDS